MEQAASGKIRLITAELVLAEVVWVLESAYGLGNKEVAPMIKAIMATPGLKVTNKPLISQALHYYTSHNIDFIDAYITALMENMQITEIYSFNKRHISRIKRIKQVEP